MTENLAGDLGIINCRRKTKRERKGKTMGDEKAGEMKRRGIEIVRAGGGGVWERKTERGVEEENV
jgi:hypothetical protein